MGTPSSIIRTLQSQLQGDSNLGIVSDDYIFLGVRANVSKFPCIFLEPLRIEESEFVSTKQEMFFNIGIIGFVKHLGTDKDDVIADSSLVGIMDLENRIKLAVDSDLTIGGEAIHTEIIETRYNYNSYPERSVEVEIRIRFRQTQGTRT